MVWRLPKPGSQWGNPSVRTLTKAFLEFPLGQKSSVFFRQLLAQLPSLNS